MFAIVIKIILIIQKPIILFATPSLYIFSSSISNRAPKPIIIDVISVESIKKQLTMIKILNIPRKY